MPVKTHERKKAPFYLLWIKEQLDLSLQDLFPLKEFDLQTIGKAVLRRTLFELEGVQGQVLNHFRYSFKVLIQYCVIKKLTHYCVMTS